METCANDSTSNKKLPVHLRDFSQDIKDFMDKYHAYCGMLGENIALRRYMWEVFSGIVQMHIDEYTIPQYGDYPNDNLASFTAEDCLKNISRYAARLKSNSRGEDEVLSDLLKIAHYAGSAYLKLKGYEELFVVPEKKEEPFVENPENEAISMMADASEITEEEWNENNSDAK